MKKLIKKALQQWVLQTFKHFGGGADIYLILVLKISNKQNSFMSISAFFYFSFFFHFYR